MDFSICDSELNIMNIVWEEGGTRAVVIAHRLREEIGWSLNTTYTVIKKCVQKGYLERIEPGYYCKPLISKDEMQKSETRLLIRRLFNNNAMDFANSFFENVPLSDEEKSTFIQKMKENDLLAELNFDNIPNVKNIDPQYMEMSKQFDPENKYSVPYTWGTVGILYNTKLIEEKGLPVPTKWSDLWNPAYKGEILMQDSVRDAFMVALKKDGFSANSTDETELQQAKQDLIDQKPLIQAYVIDQVRDKMIGGEAAIGVIYSGEIMYIQDEVAAQNLPFSLEYVIPEEGTNVWLDSWVVPKNAKNKENAEKWINFLCRPDVAVKNFEYITYATPNKAAKEMLDEEIQNNKAVFPDAKQLKNCEVYRYLGDEADELYNSLWKEVKSD